MSFGREVRRRRVALGLTLEQLAEKSGLTASYIGTVETGRRDPSLSTVLSLSQGLGVAVSELLGGSADLSPMAMEAARHFDAFPQEVQMAFLKLLRTIPRRRR
jgi:transcriptional regulator with XRE-family HTH domain